MITAGNTRDTRSLVSISLLLQESFIKATLKLVDHIMITKILRSFQLILESTNLMFEILRMCFTPQVHDFKNLLSLVNPIIVMSRISAIPSAREMVLIPLKRNPPFFEFPTNVISDLKKGLPNLKIMGQRSEVE